MSEFFLPVRVYYEDTDLGGVVYHANYIKFFERARTEMLRTLGCELDQLQAVDGVIFAVRSLQVEYLQSARFNDALQVSAKLTLIKKASLHFAQTVYRGDDLLATCNNRIACLNASTLRPSAIPDHLLRALLKE